MTTVTQLDENNNVYFDFDDYKASQEVTKVFVHVASHLIRQGRASMRPDGLCMYRQDTFDGLLMCAVGCLIQEDKYSEKLEGEPIYNKAVQEALPDWARSRDALRMLRALQYMHGRSPTKAWPTLLYGIGLAFGVNKADIQAAGVSIGLELVNNKFVLREDIGFS